MEQNYTLHYRLSLLYDHVIPVLRKKFEKEWPAHHGIQWNYHSFKTLLKTISDLKIRNQIEREIEQFRRQREENHKIRSNKRQKTGYERESHIYIHDWDIQLWCKIILNSTIFNNLKWEQKAMIKDILIFRNKYSHKGNPNKLNADKITKQVYEKYHKLFFDIIAAFGNNEEKEEIELNISNVEVKLKTFLSKATFENITPNYCDYNNQLYAQKFLNLGLEKHRDNHFWGSLTLCSMAINHCTPISGTSDMLLLILIPTYLFRTAIYAEIYSFDNSINDIESAKSICRKSMTKIKNYSQRTEMENRIWKTKISFLKSVLVLELEVKKIARLGKPPEFELSDAIKKWELYSQAAISHIQARKIYVNDPKLEKKSRKIEENFMKTEEKFKKHRELTYKGGNFQFMEIFLRLLIKSDLI